MLKATATPRTQSRRALARAGGAFLLGALLSLLGMLQKPPRLEFRFLETLVVGLGVLLASAGLLGVVAALAGPLGRAEEPEARPVQARALLPGLAQIVGFVLALRFLVNWAIAGSVPAPYVTLGIAVPALCIGILWGALRCADQLGLGRPAAEGT